MPDNLPTSSSRSFFEKWENAYARSSRLPGAFLFSGPEGVGKKACALRMAARLLGATEDSLSRQGDFIQLRPDDKGSLKIDAIRALLQRLSMKPISAPHIVALIEDAHLMTTGAANALLKTLEEPPSFVVFFLLTPSPDRLLSTIRSRCQKVAFHGDLALARSRVETLLEQSPAFRDILLPSLGRPQKFSEASKAAETLAKDGAALEPVFSLLQTVWHDALMKQIATVSTHSDFFLAPPLASLAEALAAKPHDTLARDLDLILETERALEGNVNKTLALERLFETLGRFP